MAMEPITLFARTADPAGVARLLREIAPSVEFDGPDEIWRNAVVTFREHEGSPTLTFTHDPAYYSEPNWSIQMSGMRGYFSRFPESERKPLVMALTTTFRFSLGTLFEPDFNPERDPRLSILFAVTEFLDGVLFNPSSLRDAHGRILFDAGGEDEEEADAVWPRVLGEVSVSDPVGSMMHEASRPRDPDKVEEGGEPPSARRVARRALALTVLTTRAVLEREFLEGMGEEVNETYRDLLGWVREIDIGDEFEPDEWEILQRPLGKLDEQQMINTIWRLEGLVVLAWALGRYEIPPHDELVQMNPLWNSLGWFDSEASQALLQNPSLRPREEIVALRNRLFTVHWRLRNYYLRPGVMDFAEFARTCWFGPMDVTGLPLIDGDLGIQGQRIDQASRDAFSIAHSAAQERHQAANWLYEGPDRYSHADVAT